MSTHCTDAETGKMLHAYEIGQLDETDIQTFEAHVIECPACLDDLISMEQSVETMITDARLRSLIEDAASQEQTERASLLDRLRSAVWPEGNWFLKPALAYAAVAMLLYPAYLGLRFSGPDGPQIATTILLNTTRSVSVPATAGDQPVVLFFRVFGHTQGSNYNVSLWSDTDELLYRDAAFSSVDSRQMGTLSLPAGMTPPGQYRLVIERPDGTAVREYTFELQ